MTGKTLLTTYGHYKRLLEEVTSRSPEIKHKLEQLNSQYEFRDGLPKNNLIVTMNDGVTRE